MSDYVPFPTPVWHGGALIGRFSESTTHHGLYDAWLGPAGYTILAKGVSRSDAIKSIVEFNMR